MGPRTRKSPMLPILRWLDLDPMTTQSTLAEFDPELAAAIAAEAVRQEDHVELIASENYASERVMAAQVRC